MAWFCLWCSSIRRLNDQNWGWPYCHHNLKGVKQYQWWKIIFLSKESFVFLCQKEEKKIICNWSRGCSTNSLVTDSFANPFPPNIGVYKTKLLRLNRCHLCHLRGMYLNRNSAPSRLPSKHTFVWQSGWASRWSVCFQQGLNNQTRYNDLSLYI